MKLLAQIMIKANIHQKKRVKFFKQLGFEVLLTLNEQLVQNIFIRAFIQKTAYFMEISDE